MALTAGFLLWAGVVWFMVATLAFPAEDESYLWAILTFGAVGLVFLGRVAERILASRRDPPGLGDEEAEHEVLKVFKGHGKLTPASAALRTTLTEQGAARALEKLVEDGRVRVDAQDGVHIYALREHGHVGPKGLGPERTGLPADGSPPRDERRDRRSKEVPAGEPLSKRESEVLRLLDSGRTNSEIAEDLFVAVGTVKTHANSIYRKLGARNRAEALARARDLQLLP